MRRWPLGTMCDRQLRNASKRRANCALLMRETTSDKRHPYIDNALQDRRAKLEDDVCCETKCCVWIDPWSAPAMTWPRSLRTWRGARRRTLLRCRSITLAHERLWLLRIRMDHETTASVWQPRARAGPGSMHSHTSMIKYDGILPRWVTTLRTNRIE
jgi:hypothetical protein